jgi:type II secretory pathway pseudopilin PulG
MRKTARSGFTFLELQVAFVVFGIALAGLGPLVVMQLRQCERLEDRFNTTTTYYLDPSLDEWARKLGAAALVRTQDPAPRPPPAPPPAVKIVDDGDADYSEVGSDWTHDNDAPSFQSDRSRHDNGSGSNNAKWTFSALYSGWYEIFVTWKEIGNQATNAPFTVYDAAVAEGTVLVNQKIQPSGPTFSGAQWLSLGKFAIGQTALDAVPSNSMRVELSDDANGKVIADAVRIAHLKNVVSVVSIDKSLTSEDVTVHVALKVNTPR